MQCSQNAVPTSEVIEDFINFRYKCFHDAQLIDEVIYKGETMIVDMQEIIGEKSFYTLLNIAKFCDFPLPDEKQKGFFEKKVIEYEGFLPLTLHICEQGIRGDIFITTPFLLVLNEYKLSYESDAKYCDAKPNLHTQDISKIVLNEAHNDILIATDKNFLQNLQEKSKLFEKIKIYLNDLIYHIEKQKSLEDKRKLTEEDVLRFFKEDKNLYIKFDKVLNQHLSYLKQNRPDIIASWKFYESFKQMKNY